MVIALFLVLATEIYVILKFEERIHTWVGVYYC